MEQRTVQFFVQRVVNTEPEKTFFKKGMCTSIVPCKQHSRWSEEKRSKPLWARWVNRQGGLIDLSGGSNSIGTATSAGSID